MATDTGLCSGCDPLTPDDIAEVVVFVAGRRQNVVVADTLIFPSHQVGIHLRACSRSTCANNPAGCGGRVASQTDMIRRSPCTRWWVSMLGVRVIILVTHVGSELIDYVEDTPELFVCLPGIFGSELAVC
jgi:hypothetical protein